MGATLNDILPRLNNVKYMSIIDPSSGYHNLKLDDKLSYLTIFACPFGQYQYKWLQFGTAPVGNMCSNIKLMKYSVICKIYWHCG